MGACQVRDGVDGPVAGRSGRRLRHLPAALDEAARTTRGKPYRRYQELLADPRVDAVCIATPDRHHARQAIDACGPARTCIARSR